MKPEDLIRTEEKVRYVLEHHAAARNSDKSLRYFLLKDFVFPNLTYEEFSRMEVFNPETVRRARQKLNHEGEYLPTDESIMRLRGYSESEIRQYFRERKKEGEI